MKCRVALSMVLALLVLGAGRPLLASASRGEGKPDHARHTFTIPEDTGQKAVFRFPPGHRVRSETIRISVGASELTSTDSALPERGRFRLLYGAAVLLSAEDRGKEVTVSYDFTPLRIAMVPPIDQTDLDYMGKYLTEVSRERLAELGFEVIPPDETGLAMSSLRCSFDAVITGTGSEPSQEQIVRLAGSLDASQICLLSIRSTQNNSGNRLGIAVTIVLYDGDTGTLLKNRVREASETQRWRWQSSKAGRKSLIRVSVAELFADAFN